MQELNRLVLRALLVMVAIVALSACGGSEDAARATGDASEPAAGSALEAGRILMNPAAVALTEEFAPVDPGTYRIDSVGTPFTFTTTEPLFVFRNGPAWFVLAVPESQGPGDRELLFMRMSHLSDPERPSVSIDELDEPWPARDFEGWLQNLTDEVLVSDRQQVMLGGLAATRIDLRLGELGCGSRFEFCADFASNHLAVRKPLDPGAEYRMWFIAQGDEDPLVVIVAINREDDAAWFDTADDILSTVAFGQVGPNPVFELAAGVFESDYLGGIRAELPERSVAFTDPRGFGRIGGPGEPAGAEFMAGLFDTDGAILGTSAEVITALDTAGVAVTDLDPVDVDGIEATVVDITSTATRPLLKLRSDDIDEIGWWAPPRGRLWILDHPDRGLLMVTVWAYEEIDTEFMPMVENIERLLASLEFIELN